MTTHASVAGGRPRILFLNNQGLASIGGGVTIMRHLVDNLARDAAVTVLSYDPPGPAPDGVRQITLPPPTMGRLWRLAPLVRARHLARVVPAVELATADLTIALDCHFARVLRRARHGSLVYLSLSCIPRQEWVRAHGLEATLGFLQYMALERSLARTADLVVVSSALHAAELRQFELLPGLQPRVLYPVFPGPPPRPRSAGSDGVVTILSAGRLDKVKNYAAVIEMAARLHDLPCRFVLAGDGSESSSLRALAAAKGVAHMVHFAGSVADIGVLLADADLFLHPSRYESFGIAVFEAMRAGVAPVCAHGAVAGYREIIHDGINSLIVDFEAPEAAAAALRGLVTSPARAAMGAAARDTASHLLARSGYTTEFGRAVAGLLPAVAK